jgi:hypothetical protein
MNSQVKSVVFFVDGDWCRETLFVMRILGLSGLDVLERYFFLIACSLVITLCSCSL